MRKQKYKLDIPIEDVHEISRHETSGLNGLLYVISILCVLIYAAFVVKLFRLEGTGIFQFVTEYSDMFSFPILITAVFYAFISIVRFMLTQSNDKYYTKSKYSLFGIIVSLITVTAAIMTIVKFLFK